MGGHRIAFATITRHHALPDELQCGQMEGQAAQKAKPRCKEPTWIGLLYALEAACSLSLFLCSVLPKIPPEIEKREGALFGSTDTLYAAYAYVGHSGLG